MAVVLDRKSIWRTSSRAAPPISSGVTANPSATIEIDTAIRTGSSRALVPLFSLTSFLSSGLLFLVQPMVAKMLLPLLGGSAAVWNTAMVFFQGSLLGGYAYAHLSTTRLGVRRQSKVQLVLLALPLALLPIAVPDGWTPPTDLAPSLWTLLALTVMVGAPFFVLATSSPTLQRWFAETDHPRAQDPYFLYAAGNAGSLIALVSYPLVLEPRLSLGQQSRVWTTLYVALLVCCAGCVAVLSRASRAGCEASPSSTGRADGAGANASAVDADPSPIPWARRGRWTALALVPSGLMLATTLHVSTEVSAIPLLWVIPLSCYLVTFIVAFGTRGTAVTRLASRALRLLLIPVALGSVARFPSAWVSVLLPLVTFFVAALLAHGRLAADRPEAGQLTEFYFWLSVGGVLGGILGALVAPVVLNSVAEYPLFLVAAASLVLPELAWSRSADADHAGQRPRISLRSGLGWSAFCTLVLASALIRADATGLAGARLSIAVVGAACVGVYLLARSSAAFACGMGVVLLSTVAVPSEPTLLSERTFFGVHRVFEDDEGRHVLVHGSTVHGMEQVEGAGRGVPLTYYHRTGPVGQYFAALEDASPRRIAVIGLGSGAIAAYGRDGDELTFYEIDEAVVDIATDPSIFTFVSETEASTSFQIGDGRLEVAQAPSDSFDLIVVDAFSSDAIPFHLLTTEALELYLGRLAPGGQILLHISNNYFDLEPVVSRMVEELGLSAAAQKDFPTAAEEEAGKLASHWVLVGDDEAALAAATGNDPWRPLVEPGSAPLFTDSRSDVLSIFKWDQA